MNAIENILYFTNQQKILRFLLSNAEQKFYDRQISLLANVSRAGTNFALRDLAKAGIVEREKQGRMNYYHVSLRDPLIREMKVILNIATLQELLHKCKPWCRKIVIFGSAAKGENTADSDYDIMFLSNEKSKVHEIILKSGLREKVQPMVVTQNELAAMKTKNQVFYNEVMGGKVLWEKP
jgi:predicted nucleotidyltransferase